jgi:acetyltransferase-like isoleucine patch superfamily enzyme
MSNILIEKETELTKEEKAMFAYFGEGAKIKPPFRILNPHRIKIGDKTSIREGAYLHAYQDLSELMNYINPKYKSDFDINDYFYDSEITVGNEVQIGRFMLISCTSSIIIEDNVVFSERVFIGDNNHSFSHPEVPIMQQPNRRGKPVLIGKGSWIGIGAALLAGTKLGKNNVVSSNSVVSDVFEDHSVIGMEKAKLLFKKKYE